MKYVSDEDIYERYIRDKISFKKSFFSPFREETMPSMTFIRMGNGDILWRDWGDNLQSKPESVVKFVMRCYNCDFQEALMHIREDFGGGKHNITFTKRPYSIRDKNKRKEIQILSRYFDENDINYWEQYGVRLDTLTLYDVIPISKWFYNNYPMTSYDGLRPLYAYRLVKDGNIYYKIYNPLAEEKHNKWRYNGTDDILLGYDQLPMTNQLLILTKSLKDVMVLHEMGYHSVSLQSETTELNTDLFALLKRRFNNIVVLYDNDATGTKRSDTIHESFGLPQIFIPESTGTKDISDYVADNNIEKGKVLMAELLNKIGYQV